MHLRRRGHQRFDVDGGGVRPVRSVSINREISW
jgi:hypothetical protein